MPFALIVSMLVKAIQAAPKIIEAISASKDLTAKEKDDLKNQITEAQAGVPEWK